MKRARIYCWGLLAEVLDEYLFYNLYKLQKIWGTLPGWCEAANFTISGMSKAKIAPDELLKVKVIQDEYWMSTGCLPNFSLFREVYPAGLIESAW